MGALWIAASQGKAVWVEGLTSLLWGRVILVMRSLWTSQHGALAAAAGAINGKGVPSVPLDKGAGWQIISPQTEFRRRSTLDTGRLSEVVRAASPGRRKPDCLGTLFSRRSPNCWPPWAGRRQNCDPCESV